ncbi:MAG TPA: hypothetical protein VK539_28395 [Myxococcaceae bacterium]|nr:hypothetical protein [Myxococcaceae bacterium]
MLLPSPALFLVPALLAAATATAQINACTTGTRRIELKADAQARWNRW